MTFRIVLECRFATSRITASAEVKPGGTDNSYVRSDFAVSLFLWAVELAEVWLTVFVMGSVQ